MMKFFGYGKINWLSALGEIVLIFFGISLSLLFDEWRTSRFDKAQERQLLYLIRESVLADIDQLDYNIKVCKKAISMRDYLISSLPASPRITDSISLAYSWMGTHPSFRPQLTGYKNLEASGLYSISDEKLRMDIIEYYTRVDFLVDWRDKNQEFFDEYFTPRVINDFSEYTYQERAVPFDYEKSRSDRVFINVVKSANRRSYVTLAGLEDHKEYAVKFITRLPERP
jgi:hypothetical protein